MAAGTINVLDASTTTSTAPSGVTTVAATTADVATAAVTTAAETTAAVTTADVTTDASTSADATTTTAAATSADTTTVPTTTADAATAAPTTAAATTAPETRVFSVAGIDIAFVPRQWIVDAEANPTLTVSGGQSVEFAVSTPDLLFALHSVSGSTGTDARVAGAMGQGTSRVSWTAPNVSAPMQIFYQSEKQGYETMFGALVVLPAETVPPTTAASEATTTTTVAATTSSAAANISVTGIDTALLPKQWTIDGTMGSPNVTLYEGTTYTFVVTNPALLFAIHTVPGVANSSARLATGVTGQATEAVVFAVPVGVQTPLFYQSELSGNEAMFGVINVLPALTSAATESTASSTAATITTMTASATSAADTTTAASTAAPTSAAPVGISVRGLDIAMVPRSWVINEQPGSPLLTLVIGSSYVFNVATPQLLFAIHTVPGNTSEAARVAGVSGQATATLMWTVPADAPATLFYQSELAGYESMFGTIAVVQPTTTTGSGGASTTLPSGSSSTATATTGPSTTATSTTTAGSTTAAPTTPPVVCHTVSCCALGTRPLPTGFAEFVLVVNTTYASFDCVAYRALLLRDMALLPAQLIVLNVTAGSVIFNAAAPAGSVNSFFLLMQQGRQNPALAIGSATGPKGTVVPPATPCCSGAAAGKKKKRVVVNFFFDSIFTSGAPCQTCGSK